MIINDIRKRKSQGHGNRYGDRSFYQTSAWTKTRNAFMAVNTKCIECGGIANVCDHKVRIADGGAKLDWSNLQPMCAKCHNKKDNNAGKEK